MRQICQGGKDIVGFARHISRLPGVQSLCNKILRVWLNRLFEEKSSEGNTIIQGDQALTDQWGHFQQGLTVHLQACLGEKRLDAPRQGVRCEQADMGSIEMIQLLEI